MQSINNGPDLWDEIRGHFPQDAIIAGGAVRDYMLQHEHRDIDVFLPYQNFIDLPEEFVHDIPDIPREDEYPADSAPFAVLNYRYKDHKVQLIYTEKSPREHIDTFDIGLCQMWYDGEIHMTKAAELDWRENTLTIIRMCRKTPDRVERFQDKYGYTIQ